MIIDYTIYGDIDNGVDNGVDNDIDNDNDYMLIDNNDDV